MLKDIHPLTWFHFLSIFVDDRSTKEYMAKSDKKELILEIGARLMHQKGYNYTGIQEILKEAEVPKGSFYFYFKSKEDFGLQVIDQYATHIGNALHGYLKDDTYSPLSRLRQFLNEFLASFIDNNYQGGCPLGNLALELADTNEVFRKKLNVIFESAIEAIQALLEQAQKQGELPPNKDPKDLAHFLFFSWEGLIMQMKMSRNSQSLDQFNRIVFEQLLV
ncbi:TetR family transcriptional regulator [Marinilabiliaceae bacterium JC017]|nr:TetR family transcriptional regulator [Marinilabiliaceae bacterium JC017]